MLWLQGSMCPKNKQSRKDSSNRSEMRWLKSRHWLLRMKDLSFHRVMDFQSRCSLSPTELQQGLPTFLSSVNHMDDLQIVFGPLRQKKWKSWKRIPERIGSLYHFFKPLNEQIYQQERHVLRIEDTYNVLNGLELLTYACWINLLWKESRLNPNENGHHHYRSSFHR